MNSLPQTLQDLLDKLTFRNNTNLRPAGTVIEYSEDMLDILLKCKTDPIFFIRNYVNIIHLDKGVVKMDLYPFQERMVTAFHDNHRICVLTPRQYGKTISAAAYLLHYVLFNNDKTVAILANKQSTADEILHRVRMAYELLPKWMQAGIVTWNKRSIELDNGSRIFCAATSSTGIRGKSINCLMIDEMGFIANNLAEDFFTSVYPTISSSLESKIIITSTPHGMNMFHKFWSEAVKGTNGFTPVKVEWTEMPGRDINWYNSQKEVLGELKAAQELDCQFLGSSLTLLSGATLSTLTYDTPIKEYTDQYKGLKIYANPVKDRNYVMTVDTSRGRHLDSSAFMVFDITEYPHRIVASYNNNEVSPLFYAAIVHRLSMIYNEAYTLVEINDIGAQVADELYHTFEMENLFWSKGGDQLGKKGADPYPGIRTTTKTKRIGCANLKDIIDKQQLIVNDFQSIQELSTFIQSKSGSYAADEGYHDDMVATLFLFAWLVAQPWFSELTDKNMRNQMYTNAVQQMEDDICLGMEFSDGQETIIDDTPEERGLRENWG
jgi:hypothetical protein